MCTSVWTALNRILRYFLGFDSMTAAFLILTVRFQLPSEEQECGYPQNEENNYQSNDIDSIIRIDHVQFLQSHRWRFKVTIGNETLQFWPVETVCSESSTFETISDVRQVRDPPEINWYGVE